MYRAMNSLTPFLFLAAFAVTACGRSSFGPVEPDAPTPACTVDEDCDDGLVCNGSEICGGRCVPGTPPDCDDGVAASCSGDDCDDCFDEHVFVLAVRTKATEWPGGLE
jgi:hypothetical protein